VSWVFLLGLVSVLGLALLASLSRRAELERMQRSVQERDHAVRQGSAEAQLQHPVIDLSRCLGCATCVAVCPEDGVLEVVHGQAMVVNGARCMGIAACERECPVGAITVTLSNLEDRHDIPVLNEALEAVGSPGLFLAGEVTAHALIKTAIEQGTAVGAEVARRVAATGVRDDGPSEVLDLCVVGAGPAGLACSLEARKNGLRFVTLEQETAVGGTVAKYPRRKLVMTRPVAMPLHGRLNRATYTKEELMALWERIAAEQQLPILSGEVFVGLERDPSGGHYVIRTGSGTHAARHVCLALGRRGVPRKLGVPGEALAKVTYGLLDAGSYRDRRILVVGGGDSAVETATALARQPGNEVTLSYRKESFFRVRAENEKRIREGRRQDRLHVLFRSEVRAIHADSVELTVKNGAGAETKRLENDDVFVMAGGTPPFKLLEEAGVSFNPELRPPARRIDPQGTGLVRALTVGFALSLAALAFALGHLDYYGLPAAERAAHPKHALLRPSLNVGLWLGIASVALIALNLLYLLRRSPRVRFNPGSLKLWMTSHVATGVLALLTTLLHGGMAPGDTPGGHAFWALALLALTGAIGRYFYAYVPHAANGRELELAEVRARLRRLTERPGGNEGPGVFARRARDAVLALIEERQWRGTFFGRVLALFGVQRDLTQAFKELRREGRKQGVGEDRIQEALGLARTAHRTALMAAHFEDLRAVLATWRYLHRWIALLMVVLVVVHIVHALVYGSTFFSGGAG